MPTWPSPVQVLMPTPSRPLPTVVGPESQYSVTRAAGGGEHGVEDSEEAMTQPGPVQGGFLPEVSLPQ